MRMRVRMYVRRLACVWALSSACVRLDVWVLVRMPGREFARVRALTPDVNFHSRVHVWARA